MAEYANPGEAYQDGYQTGFEAGKIAAMNAARYYAVLDQ